MSDIEEVEKILGYKFKDSAVLNTALSHRSYANDYFGSAKYGNERLEFLGDAILDFIVSDDLYKRFPEKQEGFLSKLRAEIVCEPALAAVAEKTGLYNYMKLGKGEESKGGKNKPSLTSDLVEAVIAAVFIDGGFEEAFKVVHYLMDETIENGSLGLLPKDSKTMLQEQLQKVNKKTPRYEIVRSEGPDHDKHFYAEVYIENNVIGSGSGKSKKDAEADAARDALEKIKND